MFFSIENEADGEDTERKIYETDPHCIFSLRPLYKFDLYVGTVLFPYQKSDLNMKKAFESLPLTDDELFYSFDDLDIVVLFSTNTCSTNTTTSDEPDERLRCDNFGSASHSSFDELSVSLDFFIVYRFSQILFFLVGFQ